MNSTMCNDAPGCLRIGVGLSLALLLLPMVAVDALSLSLGQYERTVDRTDRSEVQPLEGILAEAEKGDVEGVAREIAKGQSIERRSDTGRTTIEYVDGETETAPFGGRTPLLVAVANGHREVVKLLLARGAKADAKDAEASDALLIATKAGHVGMVSDLLAITKGDLSIALGAALEAGRPDIADTLVAHGAPLSKSKGEMLELAARKNQPVSIRWLLGHGASKDQADNYGASALMHALYAKSKDAANVLLDSGAKVDIATKNGITPLHVAANLGDSAILSRILSRTRKVDRVDQDGTTALMFAVSEGHLPAVKMLVQRGANSSARRKTYPVQIGLRQVGPGAPRAMVSYHTEVAGGEFVLELARTGEIFEYLENVIDPTLAAKKKLEEKRRKALALANEAKTRSPGTILDSIRHHVGEFQILYDKHRREHPKLDGNIEIEFTIASSGLVIDSTVFTSIERDSAFAKELKDLVRRVRFRPVTRDTQTVVNAFHLDFRPNDLDKYWCTYGDKSDRVALEKAYRESFLKGGGIGRGSLTEFKYDADGRISPSFKGAVTFSGEGMNYEFVNELPGDSLPADIVGTSKPKGPGSIWRFRGSIPKSQYTRIVQRGSLPLTFVLVEGIGLVHAYGNGYAVGEHGVLTDFDGNCADKGADTSSAPGLDVFLQGLAKERSPR